ncbi:type II toxin-antitoxin system VapC family toxin [Pseudomethylobacillus aquaticus]|uniref:Type II toxin-antitoxin system VapC family toxin n=1 Tax=Pseudomethylobacillus aquaticus TaxID=2676064 RepID=A0A3N0V5R3_9PROT|nr:type II toxin-antitoxin system VapC family toxin [Pseudomethylobacillus aquaticus]ROH88126.1 type II toxin-antitoxin system VapC family toxin [Pseudomethylobacillus aquaticus]
MPQQTYLLDTNILLCALISPERLNVEIQQGLIDSQNVIYFSAASIWEIAIKASLNKANFDFSAADIQYLAIETGFTELPVHASHTLVLSTLPLHHRDPFDRLLISQAMALPAYLLTSDALLGQYSELVKITTIK